MTDPQLTCFLVTGFGRKTDYPTGRVLNLDQTFRQLVQPACDLAGINAFRAIDANLTGQIDAVMYRWIFQADLVIADLSTLNPNVFYELGVRHAQRPNTTVIIAESLLLQRIPFDLSSFVIHQYAHGGDEIDGEEQARFVPYLADLLRKIASVEERRRAAVPGLQAESDSPVFKSLIGMTPPAYAADSFILPPDYVDPATRQQAAPVSGPNLAAMMDRAEAAIRAKDFETAIAELRQAMAMQAGPDGRRKPDLFLVQRLALATYKAGEVRDANGQIDRNRALAALTEAEALLETHAAPRLSTAPETLGLSGAISKRLYDLTGDAGDLDRAIRFYERGFHIAQDYYNGINLAFLYTLKASLTEDDTDAIVSHGYANIVRRQVAEICEGLIGDEDGFAKRGDREWIYLTLAEAYQGMGRSADEARLDRKIEGLASPFARASREEQRQKLAVALAAYEQATPTAARLRAASTAEMPSASNHRAETGPDGLITIRPVLEPGRAVRSIDLSLHIDYD
ncbi:TRAFs-binding domain-containing protein [Paracoccus zhejiangensis]|uniref:DUF4071 domain-containing protein n=1 Tax=Paracoccus zhejiangensis TaxID=1077935 RepID=A0A2H5EY38_9RHOB|nr:TRAFs-binding domain-containing protein [Paracoccus zhejiangensis]AUH64210.1 DUF4071 domain-containing protein [Paracoccus zhejiangensis]